MGKDVAVVIPLYKSVPSEYDNISIAQCLRVLGRYDVKVVKPVGLNMSNYNHFNLNEIISFDDSYFEDIQGYNRLLLDERFYEEFLDYEFILIHQTDAFVFQDSLKEWSDKGYDYIGAPWLRTKKMSKVRVFIDKIWGQYYRYYNVKKAGTDLPSRRQFINVVGNGGLSLRRAKKFYELCISEKETIANYYKRTEHWFHEDVFWSIEVNRRQKRLHIPDFLTALHFSIEGDSPERAIELINGNLPFGCHAWDKYLEFWMPIILSKSMGKTNCEEPNN